MKEAGVDISSQHPKAIEDVEFPDVVISMDAENPCSIPDVTCIDWSLASPEDAMRHSIKECAIS